MGFNLRRRVRRTLGKALAIPLYRTDSFASHRPILREAVVRSTGPILELGCGEGSTPLLHELCSGSNRFILTLDDDPTYLGPYARHFACECHHFEQVNNWDASVRSCAQAPTWSIILIDSGHAADRLLALQLLKDRGDFVVIHDSEAWARWGIGDCTEAFHSWSEYGVSPWLALGTRFPQTVLGSNRVDCNIHIPGTLRLRASEV